MFGQLVKSASTWQHDVQLLATFGELTSYDPTTHTAKFLLPNHPDPDTFEPYEVGPLSIGTLFTGPSFGAQFPPAVGTQALILYIDNARRLPICAFFCFNQVEQPPFPDGNTYGWKDSAGNQISTSTANGGSAEILSELVSLGATGLDTNLDAVLTVRHFIQWINSDYALHNHSGVQSGPGTTGPPITTTIPMGSSSVKAEP